MNARDAKREMKANINLGFSHAVLLRDKKGSWRTELHSGHAGNCCCNEHKDFVWREESPYTEPRDVDGIFARSAAAATLGRKGGSVKSDRKATAARENGRKGGAPWQNWVVGDTPESCIPLGKQTPEEHGLPDTVKVVKARSAREAAEKGDGLKKVE